MYPPGDDELIAYLDGELSTERRGEISHLIEMSPALRARLDGMQEDSGTFDTIAAHATPSLGDEDDLWESLRARIEQNVPPAPKPSLTVKPGPVVAVNRERPLWWRLAPGLATACAAIAVMLWVAPWPAVSADTVLLRARQAESLHLNAVPSPVVHRKLRIVRTDAASRLREESTVDQWTTSVSGERRERIEAAATRAVATTVWEELNRVLDRNSLDHRDLLSATAYSEWRSRIHASSEEVVRSRLDDGTNTYDIHTTFDAGNGAERVLQSDFIVRASDWQPVENRLRVRTTSGESNYSIRAVEFSVVARASLPDGYFEPELVGREVRARAIPPPALASVPTPATEIDQPRIVPAVPPAPLEQEIEALYALHRTGACNSDAVRVARDSSGHVEVRGSVSDSQRREQILAMLATIPRVSSDLRVGPKERVGEAAATAKARALLAAVAYEKLSAAETEALELSATSLLALVASDTEALRQLVTPYSEEQLIELPATTRGHLRTMIEEHLTAVDSNLRQLARMLDRASGTARTPATDATGIGGWWPATRSLIEALRQFPDSPSAAEHMRALAGQTRQIKTLVNTALAPVPAEARSSRQ